MGDLGYGDLGGYGVHDAKTPNLDRLTREGVRFIRRVRKWPKTARRRALLIVVTINGGWVLSGRWRGAIENRRLSVTGRLLVLPEAERCASCVNRLNDNSGPARRCFESNF